MPERLEEPTPAVVAERDLAVPVERAAIAKVSLPAVVQWHVVLGGREYCVHRPVAEVPLAVREYMLIAGAEDAPVLLRD